MPHLATCDVCRGRLADLRLTISRASRVDAPEPSPLFWDHLSARVRKAVAAEGTSDRGWRLGGWLRPRVTVSLLAAAFGLAVVAVVVKAPPVVPRIPSRPLPGVARVIAVPDLGPLAPLGRSDDPTLKLIADYGSSLDWDEMRKEMAPTPHAGGVDKALGNLSGRELRELQRLLKAELEQPSVLGGRS